MKPAEHPTAQAPSVSIIIPTYNEANNLPTALEAICNKSGVFEIIVVDAGSQDATCQIANEHNAVVIHSPIQQRAHQMNLGAQTAHANTLLFLHADSSLPANALEHLQKFEQTNCVGGAFARTYNHRSKFLKVTTCLANLRTRHFGYALGDQSIFCTRQAFDTLQGYPVWDCFEDLAFSMRLKKLGPLYFVPSKVTTSGRRFVKKGPLIQTLVDLKMTFQFIQNQRNK